MNLTSGITYYFVVHLPHKSRSHQTQPLVTISLYQYLLAVTNILLINSLNFLIGKAMGQVHFMVLDFCAPRKKSIIFEDIPCRKCFSICHIYGIDIIVVLCDCVVCCKAMALLKDCHDSNDMSAVCVMLHF
jgi:hypothetical protein